MGTNGLGGPEMREELRQLKDDVIKNISVIRALKGERLVISQVTPPIRIEINLTDNWTSSLQTLVSTSPPPVESAARASLTRRSFLTTPPCALKLTTRRCLSTRMARGAESGGGGWRRGFRRRT
jgi:hypothetical protein